MHDTEWHFCSKASNDQRRCPFQYCSSIQLCANSSLYIRHLNSLKTLDCLEWKRSLSDDALLQFVCLCWQERFERTWSDLPRLWANQKSHRLARVSQKFDWGVAWTRPIITTTTYWDARVTSNRATQYGFYVADRIAWVSNDLPRINQSTKCVQTAQWLHQST